MSLEQRKRRVLLSCTPKQNKLPLQKEKSNLMDLKLPLQDEEESSMEREVMIENRNASCRNQNGAKPIKCPSSSRLNEMRDTLEKESEEFRFNQSSWMMYMRILKSRKKRCFVIDGNYDDKNKIEHKSSIKENKNSGRLKSSLSMPHFDHINELNQFIPRQDEYEDNEVFHFEM